MGKIIASFSHLVWCWVCTWCTGVVCGSLSSQTICLPWPVLDSGTKLDTRTHFQWAVAAQFKALSGA
jgi:hypothetical protein